MNQILCSTGALLGRANNADYGMLKEYASHLDCDGYEFMVYSRWYNCMEELIFKMKQNELKIPVIHCEKKIGELISKGQEGDLEEALHLFEQNCHITKELGADKIVLHLWNGITSDRNFKNNLKAFQWIEDIGHNYGVDVMVENVVCNTEDPMTHMAQLYETYPEIQFTFDTKMAAFHHQLELAYTKQYRWMWEEKHVKHLHVNDYLGGYMDWENLHPLHIGEGIIDMSQFISFIKKMNYEQDFTLETSAIRQDGTIDYKKINDSIGRLRRLLNE